MAKNILFTQRVRKYQGTYVAVSRGKVVASGKHAREVFQLAKRLIALGVKPKTAWNGIYKGHRSLWALSHSTAVDRGLRNAYFAERGLESLAERWREHHTWDAIAPAPVPG